MLKSVINKAVNAAGFMLVRRHDTPYDQEGLSTFHNHDFIDDPKFKAAVQRGVDGTPGQPFRPSPWRLHVAMWAAETAMRRDGDFVECGVFLGFVSSVIMNFTSWNETPHSKRFLLIDSFEGLQASILTPEEIAAGRADRYGDEYTDTFLRASKNLSDFRNTQIIKGFVPQVLSQVHCDRVAYLHIDMNAAAPEVAALEYFWPRVSPGGIVLLDDYAFNEHIAQKNALDELGEKLGYTVASLPTGQGLIVK